MPLSRPKNLGRDAKPPVANSSQVATSISGRDLKLTRPGHDLKVTSRPQVVFLRSQHEFHVTTQDPSVLTSARSRHQKDVATLTPPGEVARTTPLPCAPCALFVTTPNLGRDPSLEFGSSYSSFCLAPKVFFFFFSKFSNSLPATPRMK